MKKILSVLMLGAMSFVTTSYVLAAPIQTAKHLKKDGTHDKRFKQNNTKHLTKSGKPDMRYKANNPNVGKKKKK